MNATVCKEARPRQQADVEYDQFCLAVRKQSGLDLSAYKRGQMERRIRAMAERKGDTTLQEFWQRISRNSAELREFLDRVTINVSEFFRNPEKFEDLRRVVFPDLLRQRQTLTVWSAGCSYGAEPYSLRILLHQISPGVNHRILATDIDDGVLERARQGLFTAEDIRNMPEPLRRRYLTQEEGLFRVAPVVREGVEFRRHDLLRDAFPRQVDLILCRNVVIYFSEETKRDLFERFSEALRPGGYLLIGSTERIFAAEAIGFRTPAPFLYQKACLGME